jgi:putative ABC transport system permease protein
MARQFWPDSNPIGKRVRMADADEDQTWMTVVGIAHDIRQYGLEVDSRPTIYVPLPQHPFKTMYLAVRTKTAADEMAGVVRSAILSLEREAAVFEAGTMSKSISDSVAQQRLAALLILMFGAAALLLAAFGVHAALSHLVAQRSKEIGIRMAIGASPPDVLWQIMRQGCGLALIGVACGTLAGIASGRLLGGLLYQTVSYDPRVIAGAVLILTIAGLLSTYSPARKAMRVDPATALRSER